MILNILASIFNFYLCGALLVLYFIYKYATWTFTLEDEYGYRGPKPLPFIGNALYFLKNSYDWDVENQKLYGHIYPVYIGKRGLFVVSDEAMLKQILIKDSKSFIDREIFRISSKTSKHGLLELKGQAWERVRALVSPTFTSGKLKNMFPMIEKSVKEMIDNLPTKSDINSKEVFSLLTMDVIAKTMFGMEINVYENKANHFIEHAKSLFKLPTANKVFIISEIFHIKRIVEYLFPNGVVSPKSTAFLENSLAVNISARKNSNEEYQDFLALMLKAHNELENTTNLTENNKLYSGLTGEEVMAQSMIFLLAGYETTASLLTFCSYYLAMNSDMQNEIYHEILRNIPEKTKLSYDILTNLNLLEQCINECLRICPPVVRITRECTKDTTLISTTGQIIQAKKGMGFVIPVNVIHHDERLWPEPNKFDIHRFDKENRNRTQFNFMPFGMGPRMCVGMRFAILEAKLALANLLLNYEIRPCDKTPKQLNFESHILVITKEPVIVALKKR